MPARRDQHPATGYWIYMTSVITVLIVILVLWFVLKLAGAAIRLIMTVLSLAIIAAIVYFVLMR